MPARTVPAVPVWMPVTLIAAAIYNLAWGAVVVLFPLLPFRLAGMAAPNYLPIWQCVGMIVGVYGVGYALAARDPVRHWPIVLVGLLGKIFGPVGFFWAASRGELPWIAGWTVITNDLIWWGPFLGILAHVYRYERSLYHAGSRADVTVSERAGPGADTERP